MKVEKAIEILDLNLKAAGNNMPQDCRDALLLGILALRRLSGRHVLTLNGILQPLPGETED